MPDSPIKSVKDLKGKKFAISNPKSLGEMTIVAAAEQVGINPDDIQRVALGNLSGALTALENHVVDATSIPGILFLMRGGESKYHVIMGPTELPVLPPAAGIASTDLMKNHPDKLRAILAARREGGAIHRPAHRRRQQGFGEGLRAAAAQGRQHHDAPARRSKVLQRGPDRDATPANHGARHAPRRHAR